MTQSRLFFIQIQTLPLRMHHKWKELVKQNNQWQIIVDQLLTKVTFESTDNSIESKVMHLKLT